MLSPRLHARWSVTENVSWKIAAGRGFRTPNPFMEQLGTWASQRQWYWGYDSQGLQPEIATNIGTNLTSKFRLNYREAPCVGCALRVREQARGGSRPGDGCHSPVQPVWEFLRQHGPSGVQLGHAPPVGRAPRVPWVNAHTDRILGNPTEDPFVSKHRGFSQISYASQLDEREGQWRAMPPSSGSVLNAFLPPRRTPSRSAARTMLRISSS